MKAFKTAHDLYQSTEFRALRRNLMQERTNADTYIQRRNIKDAPEREGVDDPGWVCESRKISADVYEALMEEYNSATYQALMEQNEALDAANAMTMLSQANIEDRQADQDDTLGLILLNTEKEEG